MPSTPSRGQLLPAALAVAACIGWTVVRAHQVSPPQFKTGIDVVSLAVGVVDKDHKPIKGLRAEDFTVLEDGKTRPIVTFSEETIAAAPPPGPVWRDKFSPDVATNSTNAQRLVVIAMTYITGMDPWALQKATELGHGIVDRLGPEDMAAVVWLQRAQAGQSFTTDRAKLHAAIDRRLPGEVAVNSDCAFDTLFDVFGDFPEKRKLIIEVRPPKLASQTDIVSRFAAGGGRRVAGPSPRQECSSSTMPRDSRIQRANVGIYALDPNGLEMQTHMSVTRDQLATYGYTIADTNVPEQHIDTVLSESSSFYLIAYESAKDKPEDFRHLNVKVNRPGVTVMAPKNWYSTAPTAKELADPKKNKPLERAIESSLPTAAIPMRMSAMPFASAKGAPNVALSVGVTVPGAKGGAATAEKIDLLARAYDLDGKLSGTTRQSASLTLRRDGADVHIEMLMNLPLKPNRYQIRVSASSAALKTTGSVYVDLEVPDFGGEALSLSAIALATDPVGPTAPKDAFANFLPIVPTSERVIATGTAADVLLRVY